MFLAANLNCSQHCSQINQKGSTSTSLPIILLQIHALKSFGTMQKRVLLNTFHPWRHIGEFCVGNMLTTLKRYFQQEKMGLLKTGTGGRMQYWTDVSIQRICYLAALPFWTNQCKHAKQKQQGAILNKPVQNNQKHIDMRFHVSGWANNQSGGFCSFFSSHLSYSSNL